MNKTTERISSIQEYARLAQRTANKELDTEKRIAIAGLGLAAEAAEVADVIKKHLGHGHSLNKEQIIKELGDNLWYIIEICSILNVPITEVMEVNIDKLQKRYPEGFSEERSRNREHEDI